MEIKHVGVFCAASDRLDAAYYAMAREFGRWLGGRGLTLVYGGADSGLMESVAEGVKSAGGRVPATSYSPKPFPAQYHQRLEA